MSEVLGYVLVFSIVLVALTTASLYGVNAVEEVRQSSVADSGEWGMKALSADLRELVRGSHMSRSTELTLDSSSLHVGETVFVTVNVDGGAAEIAGQPVEPIVYRTERADITYVNSLLLRDQGDGAVSIDGPFGTYSQTETILPVVATKGGSTEIVSGGTRRVESVVTETDGFVNSTATGPHTVDLTMTNLPDEQDEAWMRTLNDRFQSIDPCAVNGGNLECTFTTDSLVVMVVTVEYRLN